MTQADPRQRSLMAWINTLPEQRIERFEIVSGDASFRRYFRFSDKSGSLIAVDAPPEHEDNPRFVAVAECYLNNNVKVPKLVAHDFEQGFMCQEDFGDTLLSDRIDADNAAVLYANALDILPDIQRSVETSQGPIPNFDDALLQSEFHLFSHWLVEVHLKLQLTEREQACMSECFAQLKQAFESQPQVGVHRDYHSRNLMLLDGDSIGVIDFQDAVVGPITYDAVSLLRDCYQDWDKQLVLDILRDFHKRHHHQYDWPTYKQWFDLTGIQRHVKASGIFARLCHRDGKHLYLEDIPHTLDYIIDVGAEYEGVAEFAALVRDKIKPAMVASLA